LLNIEVRPSWLTTGRSIAQKITMKKQNTSNKRSWIIPLALCTAGCVAYGQGGGSDGPGGDGPPPRPPLPPVIQALDTNHDGIIEADEIANAPQSLRTLEKSGSDVLTIPELLGPPPWRRHRGGQQPPGNPPQSSGTQSADADSQTGPPPPDAPPPQDQGGQGGPQGNAQGPQGNDQDGPPPGPPPGGHHRPPPVIEVLDANHDGIIDATEINNAAQSLKKLDRNGTGQLTIEELLGPPPFGRGPHGPPPGQDGPDDQGPSSQTGTNAQPSGPPPQ
jgi:hypothetical protein